MKKINYLKRFIVLIFLLLFANINTSYAQCISENSYSTHKPWNNIPKVDGDNSYLRIQEGSNVSDSHNAANWLENDFTVDLWLKCTWPNDNSSDDIYTFLSAGDWGDDYNSLYLMFQRTSSTNWQIRLSDGFDADSEDDLRFTNFNYGNDFMDKWQHLTITYNNLGNMMTLYWNGSYATSGTFHLGTIPWRSIFLGSADDDYRNRDFRGFYSGVRIWTKELTSAQVLYVWDKTFHEVETLRSDMTDLYDNTLKINMFTGENNTYSLTSDKAILETNVYYYTSEYHPARSVNIYNLSATKYCNSIRLNWTKGTTYTTSYIYRKKEGESGMGTFLCGVSGNSYTDDDANLEPGQNYEYYVRSVWRNPNNPLNTNSGYYDAENYDVNDVAKITSSLKKYSKANNFVADHASTGNCDGSIKFTWNEYSSDASYTLFYKDDNGNYQSIMTVDNNEATYTPSEDNYGKSIIYTLDVVGDGCINYSDEISAIANTECSTPPSNQDAVVVDDNINVSWDYSQPSYGAPASYFNIYRSADGSSFELIESEYSIDARTYEDQDADMCIEYEYKIEAGNVCGADNSGTVATLVAKRPSKFDNIFTYAGTDAPYFEGSKGYYNQKVKLEWEVNPDKKSDIESYELYKRRINENFQLTSTIDNENATSYIDNQTDANEMYEYLIRAKGHCGSEQIISDTLKTLGFRVSTGIVSGKITYQGGNAVNKVDVRVSTENPVVASSLYFDGNDDYITNSKYHQDSLAYKSLTFEAWIKPELSSSGNRKMILSIDTLRFNFYLMNMQLVAVLYDTTFSATQTPIVTTSSTTELPAGDWSHVAFTLDAENGKLSIYLNGEKLASSDYSPIIPWTNPDKYHCTTTLGGALKLGQSFGFKGNIDEAKIWSTARTDEEIKNDYNRIVPNDKDGLYAYWHFDENYGDFGYDISKQNGNFNKKDLKFGDNHAPEWSSSTPSFEQLHPAGLTDERGNYIIQGIRYSGEGEIFNVAPMLGVHEFDPSDVNLFISDNTPVHNNIDFTDISSFRVTGKVKYENTNMPVKNCYIKIDGNYIQGENNSIAMTDEHGDYDIQVPIGSHNISVEKHGHTFVSQYFPGPVFDSTYYFTDDIYNLNFLDNTLVKLAGRVVGGSVEQAKPIGSQKNPSKNNLGRCQITFTTDQGYMLQNGSADTTIYTDTITGMYEIYLCPETYVIDTVKVNNTYNFLDGENDIVNMSNCFENKFTVDSVENESGDMYADTVFTYNKKKDWIRRDAPSLSVYNYNGSKVLGDSLYIINIGDEDQDTIQIANMVGDDAVYKFRKPMFSQERAYAFVTTAYETYTNQDNLEVDTVPVTDGEIIIVNNCANDKNQKNIPLNDDGYALYQFFGGLPNITPPFDNKIEISLQVGDENYLWSQSPLMAYLSGNMPTGNNFVTDGPDKVDYILRDPPGSDSYSYLEQGLEINYTKTTTTSKKWEGSENLIFHLGNQTVTSAGTGFFSVDASFELENDLTIGFEHSNDWGNEHEVNKHFAFNQSFATSSSPDYVGDMGDLFIGHSSNIFYGISNFIQIMNLNDIPLDGVAVDTVTIESEDYAVCKKKGIYLGSSDSTSFVFSQNHIENYLIPNLMMLRNNTYDNNISHYTLVFEDADDPKFLSNNDDAFYWGSQASDSTHYGPSYLYENDTEEDMIDSVWYYNEKIISWRNILKENERDKLKAIVDDNFPSNISFDAGTSYEASIQVDTLKVETNSFEFMLSPSLAVSLGFTFNKMGNHFQCEEKFVYTKNKTTSHDTTHIQTVGFVLEDGDQGDYFSVNVRKDKEHGFGPIFRTQGGQSACPYEGATRTKYYLPGTILNQATMQIEKPKISVALNNVTGVPETASAVFDLTLTNESDTEDDVWYNLLVDASSNPHGAIISIDGDPATSEGKAILVPFGNPIHKTLTIEKGQPDFNDIDSILVILHSQCQFDPTDDVDDIADSVYLTAHFVPACTTVDFEQIYNNWTANVSSDDTISFRIADYNLNSSKFKTISFQTAIPGSPRTTRMVFYKDINDFNDADEPKTFINGQSVLDYNFDISGLNDGNYELYLKTTCDDGSEFLTSPLAGIIDRVTPKPFGTPEPGDGILSAGEDIKLTFNEDVNSGDFYAHNDYIEVRGILNGTDLINNQSLLHDASLHFDGINQNMLVRNGINLNNTSYTIEFWAKRDASGRECLVSLGSLNDGLWIGFDETNHFKVKLGSNVLISDNQYLSSDDWVHYAVVYNIGDDQFDQALNIIISAGATTEEKYLETNSYTNLENILYVGYCPEDVSAFSGNMHELRIWNIYQTSGDISSMQSKILNGHEQGLYGLWKMNDASGNFAKDLVFGRNAEVNATWQVSRNGKSLSFDGASYSSVPLNEMIFDTQTDFTFEFWFKTQGTGSDMCMFSNGLSDGTLGDNSWNITAKADNTIEVQNKGISISFDASEYLNNNWQHFAMSLKRGGYLSIYINGELVKTTYASQFGGFANEKFVIGARWWYSEHTNHFDKYFLGNIDEIRIWNTVRQQSQIKNYLNNALNCDEFGLKAYFPLEDVNISNPAISNETLENLTENTYSVSGDMELFGNSTITSESPNIKLQKPIISMPFNYVVNDDMVIITPDMEPEDIENVVLDISVQNVLDTHNNRMSSPATWTAYVDKNQMIWDRQNLSVEKYIDADTTFTVNIQNTGGVSNNFEITNIPDWLEVSPSVGTLSPQETEEISITVKSVLNIGKYVRDINLVSSMGFNERLNLITKVKAHEPEWEVNPDDFEHTANLIGQLKINDIISTDTDDKVAVFINGECRGTANVQYLSAGDVYLVFMDIYDNSVAGNEITFKVFDASTGEIYSQVTPSLTFQANKLYGNTSNPVEINATIGIDQSLDLNDGWTWISFNVYNDNFNNLDNVLKNMNATQGDLIKSKNKYAQFTTNNNWAGNLNRLDYKQMYKVKATKNQSLTVSGAKVIADTVQIPIVQGWNWIGYPAHNQLDITSALSSFNPVNNDLIKSQQKFAVYDENMGWLGSLDYLQAGKGYMLSASNAGTLVFSGGNKSNNKYNTDDNNYENINLTSSNMTLIAEAELENSENYLLKAYRNDKLCGFAAPKIINNRVLYFITINGNSNDKIIFKAENNNIKLNAFEELTFYKNNHIGNLQSPFKLTFASSNIKNLVSESICNIYPNPFSNKLFANINLPVSNNIKFELYSPTGMKIFETNNKEYQKGKFQIDLTNKTNNLAKGVYLLKIITNNNVQIFQIIKK